MRYILTGLAMVFLFTVNAAHSEIGKNDDAISMFNFASAESTNCSDEIMAEPFGADYWKEAERGCVKAVEHLFWWHCEGFGWVLGTDQNVELWFRKAIAKGCTRAHFGLAERSGSAK